MAKIGLLWLTRQMGWEAGGFVQLGKTVRCRGASSIGQFSYGYGWWISDGLTGPSYDAVGNGGLRITVDPTLNLVLVTTGGGFDVDEVVSYLVAAFVDLKNPLPANPDGKIRLAEVVASLPKTTGAATGSVPARHGRRDLGKVFTFDPNPFLMESMRLDFNNSAEATVQFEFTDEQQTPYLTGRPGRPLPDNTWAGPGSGFPCVR